MNTTIETLNFSSDKAINFSLNRLMKKTILRDTPKKRKNDDGHKRVTLFHIIADEESKKYKCEAFPHFPSFEKFVFKTYS